MWKGFLSELARIAVFARWRHQMETFSALLAICAENSRSPVNSPHKGQWHGAVMFSLICIWINGWVSNREAGDLRRYRAHYDVIVIVYHSCKCPDHNCACILPLIFNIIIFMMFPKRMGFECPLTGLCRSKFRPRLPKYTFTGYALIYTNHGSCSVAKPRHHFCMMTSSNGNIFRVTGLLWGETTGDWWISLTKAGDDELWYFLWRAPQQTIEQTIETPVIWDAIALIMTSRYWRIVCSFSYEYHRRVTIICIPHCEHLGSTVIVSYEHLRRLKLCFLLDST